MKFQVHWKSQWYMMTNDTLRDNSFFYKFYKKVSKDAKKTNNLILQSLKNDTENINYIIHATLRQFKSCKDIETKKAMLNELRAFVNLNGIALYKICKRLDKRRQTDIFSQYYTECKKTSILYQRDLQCLFDMLLSGGECPICLETVKNIIVTQCNHGMCVECAKRITHSNKLRGTLRNIISFGSYHSTATIFCPLCKNPNAFQKFKNYTL